MTVLPRTRTSFGERGFQYSVSGPAAWNSLPVNLHDITDTNTFKKRLKTVRLIVHTDVLLLLYSAPGRFVSLAAPYKSRIVLYCIVY